MSTSADTPVLVKASGLTAGYLDNVVLHGVTVQVSSGEVVAVIGHNGAGKSTLLKALFGIVPICAGEVRVGGACVLRPTPRMMLRAGVAYVPQTSAVFPDLTVKDNLEVAACALGREARSQSAYNAALAFFPVLGTLLRRVAGTLSGGQRQMLALTMGLLHAPRVVLLDEPSLGLSPPLAEATFQSIRRLAHEQGIAILLVEQKVRQGLEIADRAYVLRRGSVSFEGPALALSDDELLRKYFL
jgi:ABC-type branched-subunit amino acid transport system ATPase component